MKFKWFLVIPAFILYVIALQTICMLVINWIYDRIFPVDGIMDFFFAAFGLSIIIPIPLLFFGGAFRILQMAPKVKLGARIILVVMIIPYVFAYATSFATISGLQIFLDVGILLALIVAAFGTQNENENNYA